MMSMSVRVVRVSARWRGGCGRAMNTLRPIFERVRESFADCAFVFYACGLDRIPHRRLRRLLPRRCFGGGLGFGQLGRGGCGVCDVSWLVSC